MFKKDCAICKKEFETKYKNQNICSFICRREAQRDRSKRLMRIMRNKKISSYEPCEICGFRLITELHHEPFNTHYLCPTHHAMITRNRATLIEMINNKHHYR